MKKRNFCIGIIAAILLCFCGCTESASNSQSKKRALEDSDNSIAEENTPVHTTVTTELVPLETFERITEINKEQELQTAEAFIEKKSLEIPAAETQSDWFSENKLFDMDIQDSVIESDFIETWYRFPKDDETTYTTVIINQSEEEK